MKRMTPKITKFLYILGIVAVAFGGVLFLTDHINKHYEKENKNAVFTIPVPDGAKEVTRVGKKWYTFEYEGVKLLLYRPGDSRSNISFTRLSE